MNGKCIKISLEVNKITHLTEINTELDVDCIVREICEEYSIPYRRNAFALKVRDFSKLVGTEYLTEVNKSDLKHGKHLKLSKSPSEKIGVIVDRLYKSTDSESSLRNLNALATASKDSILLAEMNKQKILGHLRAFASSTSLSEDEYYRLYKVIGQFLANGFTRNLHPEEVNHLMCLIAWDRKASIEMTVLSFELLIMLRKNGELEWPMERLRKLTPYLRQCGKRKLQERCLNLINVLYQYAKDETERNTVLEFMQSSIVINYINKYVIGECLSDEMKQQLCFYRKIILRKYEKQLRLIAFDEGKILENLESVATELASIKQDRTSLSEDVESLEMENERKRKILNGLSVPRLSSPRETKRSASVPGTNRRIETDSEETRLRNRKISVEIFGGFHSSDPAISQLNQNLLEPKETKIHSGREGHLTFLAWSNLYYFIINDFKGFERVSVFHRSNLKSILRESNEITFLLARIFEIGENNRGRKSRLFVPLCFLYYDYFIEKMFCIVLKLFHRSREEMNVSVDSSECPVVVKAVEEQVIMALESEPVEFLELEKRLEQITIEVIVRERQSMIKEDVTRQLTEEPGFVELKQILSPRIIGKIKGKRLKFMESGEHVPQFDYKGQRINGKGLFLSLTKTGDRLILEECLDNPCRNNHNPLEEVFISDIREIESGNKSNFYKEVYYNLYTERDMFFRPGTKQQEPDLRFPISLKLHNMKYIDFCAGSQLTLDYWIDGLCYLTGEKMKSESSKEEFEYLLDVELMSRLAEIEGIKLPKKAPALPPPPPDYDFSVD